jgi:hypothetical protein
MRPWKRGERFGDSGDSVDMARALSLVADSGAF